MVDYYNFHGEVPRVRNFDAGEGGVSVLDVRRRPDVGTHYVVLCGGEVRSWLRALECAEKAAYEWGLEGGFRGKK